MHLYIFIYLFKIQKTACILKSDGQLKHAPLILLIQEFKYNLIYQHIRSPNNLNS